jgi:histidinol-phosphatase (PHP family)
MWSNFHTHSYYCDGKGAPEDYLLSARQSNLNFIGFSSHAPVSFPCKWTMKNEELQNYLQEIESLKTIYPDIEIYKGLEVDFIPGIISPRDFKSVLDYTIGSIHFVDDFAGTPWEIDNSLAIFKEGLEKIFHNDIRAAITRYLQLTREMVASEAPDIAGHIDKIKIHNTPDPLFDESEKWYRDEMDKTLKAIREADVILEVNTRGLYKKKAVTTYPSPWVLERAYDLKIPITISSDAHHPEDIIREFQPSAAMLKDIGFKNLSILKSGIWKQVPFTEHGIDH